MQVSSQELAKVEQRLDKQNALVAAVAGGLWVFPILCAWFGAFTLNADFGPLMLVVSGILIGLVTRLHGRGYQKVFGVIAFILHAWLAFLALALDLIVSNDTWLMVLGILYVIGVWSSVFLARKKVPFSEHRAFFELAEKQQHASRKKLKNRWFIALPALLVSSLAASWLAIYGIAMAEQLLQEKEIFEKQQLQAQRSAKSEIDVSPEGIKALSTRQALHYAYAYFSGYRIDEFGRNKGQFVHSEFKAKTILRHLTEQRNDPRALFILGVINGGSQGSKQVEQAAERQDDYAKLFKTIEFGCRYDKTQALMLINGLSQLTDESPILAEIDSIRSYGFEPVCDELNTGKFEYSFIREYQPSSR
ncbi:hypothetical protein [Pseudoalteromonas sp. R3]|uniref:hypothetical protein n=1 Tax=Pseudoalteromonas sp. R3 TaxID=1709477 RepID=UPI0006B4FD6B|nr:hypothetical protein [Pseudoalteromonas sp. R3]AZZ99297.1 hypothetical protein ELR70_20770 [Pseudoalteromonas sp. R3]